MKNGDAAGLLDSLNTVLQEDELSWEKVTGYASDGENLMQGGNNSVLTRVREAAPGRHFICIKMLLSHISSCCRTCLRDFVENSQPANPQCLQLF